MPAAPSAERARPYATALRIVLSPPSPNPAGYFYAIDLLRGTAALSILFWHYVHFFMVGSVAHSYDPARNPFFDQFWLFYEYGGNAVQLFWLISGFTFAAVYVGRQVRTRTFVAHRFARLYPLHFITLCVIATLQIASMRLLGHSSIYDNNDLPHFIDQLFMTDGWGPTIRFSFNGPTWTVSVELLVYALFWYLLPRLFRLGSLFPMLIAAVSLGLSRLGPFQHILEGGFFFFQGCALFPLFLACRGWRAAMVTTVAVPFVAAMLVLAKWHAIGLASMLLLVSLVLCTAFVDLERGPPAARRLCKWIGDNTYGVYLWHVPVQVTILIVVGTYGVSRAVFLTPAFFICYVLGMVGFARTSFLLIERPCRTFLNARLFRPEP
ncbi:MAG: acyltransferase family protein [Janthinobacterium lividum]